jgi:hypothetical protein
MTTNNVVNVSTLSGNTGTGQFVGSNGATLVTPTLGVVTGTALSFSPTTGGIIGTTAADNPTAGNVGQFFSTVIASGSAISISNNTAKALGHVTLNQGDYDVWGNIAFIISGGQISNGYIWLNSSLTTSDGSQLAYMPGNVSGTPIGFTCLQKRFGLTAASTNIQLNAFLTFTGTCTMCGGIYARRVR